MPSDLEYTFQTHHGHLWSSWLIMVPTVTLTMTWFPLEYQVSQGTLGEGFLNVRYGFIVWWVLAALWTLARSGPVFGMESEGVWIRPGLWRRTAWFVPNDRFEWIELQPVEMKVQGWRGICGVKLRVRTDRGRCPRGLRFIPCGQEDYHLLVTALEEYDCRIEEPSPGPIGNAVMWVLVLMLGGLAIGLATGLLGF